MIKYLGSKRVLTPTLGALFAASGATTALDLFTGTTRVAQEFCRRGATVTTVDTATYSEVLSQCYVVLDEAQVDRAEVQAALDHLRALPPKDGYFTETFCVQSQYFQPKNGRRVDAIRDGIDEFYADSWLRPVLLTSLMEAADAVDSTVGLQMAYLKQWAPRAAKDLTLRLPEFTPGTGTARRGDATVLVEELPPVDLAYLDPPYNQHRYFTNYHIWETLVRWDAPEHYGVACKRIDSRDEATKSAFNLKRTMPTAFADLIGRTRARVLIVSYNDESWITAEQMVRWLRDAGHEDVRMVAFDSKRYVGAQIGIFNPAGEKVGKVSHLRNVEQIFLAGPTDLVEAAVTAARAARG
jgi:adenine-specific DNA-methyltransferase